MRWILVHILHKYECNIRIHTNTYMSATGFQSWHKYECNTLRNVPDPSHSGVVPSMTSEPHYRGVRNMSTTFFQMRQIWVQRPNHFWYIYECNTLPELTHTWVNFLRVLHSYLCQLWKPVALIYTWVWMRVLHSYMC